MRLKDYLRRFALALLILEAKSDWPTLNYSDWCPIEEGIIAGEMDDKVMEEASGLAYSKRQDAILWTQNDHGDDARVIALSDEGQRISIVNLEGVKNEDWEDIATTLIG